MAHLMAQLMAQLIMQEHAMLYFFLFVLANKLSPQTIKIQHCDMKSH